MRGDVSEAVLNDNDPAQRRLASLTLELQISQGARSAQC